METESLPPDSTDQDRILIVFGYLGPLAIFSLLASRREFVKWHAKQGLVLFAVFAALYIVLKPLYLIMNRYLWWWIGDLFWAAVMLLALGALLTMMLCIVRALEGERFKVPVLGDLADRL